MSIRASGPEASPSCVRKKLVSDPRVRHTRRRTRIPRYGNGKMFSAVHNWQSKCNRS